MRNEDAALILGVIAEQAAEIARLRSAVSAADAIIKGQSATINYGIKLECKSELAIKKARLAISSQAERRKFDAIYAAAMKGNES